MRENEITKAFVNGAPVTDMHYPGGRNTDLDALIEFNSENRPLAGWKSGHQYQSLNEIRMIGTGGGLQLTPRSVGGTIIGKTLDAETIRAYNKSVNLNSIRIKSVLFRNGEVLMTVGKDDLVEV